jgi:transcriptional regulator PpsR
VKLVQTPVGRLGGLDAAATEALLAAAGDLSLVMDADGVVLAVSFGSEEMAKEGFKKWIDQPWIETVTPDSRSKIESLLQDAGNRNGPKWRHVNHTSSRGSDIPVLYTAVAVGAQGQIVAIGRDLRDVANLQQRLMDAQQAMERDYWRLRNAETRYRMLFQMSSEAILVIEGTNGKIMEANPAAAELIGDGSKRIVGKSLLDCVGAESAQILETLIAGVRAAGRADDAVVRLGADRREYQVSSFYFRQENDALFLLRIAPMRAEAGPAGVPKAVLRALEYSADAFVVTDMDGRILSMNRSFLDLAQMPTESHVRGEPLDRWVGRSRVDFSVLMANLRQHGTIRLFATTLAGEHGAVADVEISAVSVTAADPPCLGFNIRNVGVRVSSEADTAMDMPRSVEQLTELVGRVPLKELVRDATDVVEKLCIEAALQLTGDNRASAAEMLGVSRQSLYVKLRRYGLSDSSLEPDEPESVS